MGDNNRSCSPAMMMTSDPTAVDSIAKERTLNQEQLVRKSMSTEWTNEKHSLYLKSMEASFVDDLYNSFELFGHQVNLHSDPKLLKRKNMASYASSDEFKVLQRGNCEKVAFKRNIRSRSKKVDGPNVLLANPWIRHFRSSQGRKIVSSSTLQEKVSLAADQSNRDPLEVSDQNFVDEDDIREKQSQSRYPRRIKTSITPTSSNDQVVPLANFSDSTTDFLTLLQDE